jgi:3-hydroxyacyl-CoA dehydrogenase
MGSRILHCAASAGLGVHMVSRAQLDRMATRIEALVPKSDRAVYVWRNRGETAEEVLERLRRQLIVSLDKLIFTSSAG